MKAGAVAPDFSLPDETGATRRLSVLLESGPIVLFFYPAAMTRGCTAESCHFRDLTAEFRSLGAQPVGISADRVDKQQKFSETYGFDYPLLSDTDGSVAAAFGVRRVGFLPNRRRTFVIDIDRTVLAVISSETKMDTHADQALAFLRARAATA